MKQFIAGFTIASLIFGGAAVYIYNGAQTKLDAASKAAQIEKQKNTNITKTNDTPAVQDINTLAAELRNRRLDDLASATGQAFDSNYIMMLDMTYGELATLGHEAAKRGSLAETRAIAEKVVSDANARQSELIPLRSQLNLIH